MVRVHLNNQALRRLLARRNMTQNSFARRIKVSSGYVSQLLRGQRHPSPKVRERILAELPGTDFDHLFRVADDVGRDA